MKIGIMTFWQAKENYGQILQLYALYTFLKERGHAPFLIRYDRIRGDRIPAFKSLWYKFRLLVHPNTFLKTLKNKLKRRETAVDRGLQQFVLKHIDCSDQVYSSLSELRQNPPAADVYICGSDQIWNQDECSYSPGFFLDFGPPEIMRISYAASFGKTNMSDGMIRKIVPLLRQFDMISVRENEGVELCKRIGFKAYRVPDPTMLIDKHAYLEMTSESSDRTTQPYVMMYLLGHETNIPFDDIHVWASSASLKIRYVASDCRHDSYTKETPTLSEWLTMMKGAQYVITNSFHGTVFAILFNVPFVTLPLVGQYRPMNGRITTLLQDLGMGNRLLVSSLHIKDILSKSMDFTEANQVMAKNKQQTIELLNRLTKI